MGLLAAGCNTTGQPVASLDGARGATIAFESVDGAPPAVFHKLVQNLGEEASARALPVVSRRASAAYRIRGYLAAHVAGRRTTLTWVWDIYDRDQRRALRIAGQEPTGASDSDPWAAADDLILRRIARAGMERVAMFLADTGTAPAAAPPSDEPVPRLASAWRRDDFSPEARGIFRILRTSDMPPPKTVDFDAVTPAIPLPLPRPQTASRTADATLAYAATRY